MFKVALKDLLARKRRLVTTGLAIILGIAFLTGTQLLSSALRDSIESLIGDVYEGIDAVAARLARRAPRQAADRHGARERPGPRRLPVLENV